MVEAITEPRPRADWTKKDKLRKNYFSRKRFHVKQFLQLKLESQCHATLSGFISSGVDLSRVNGHPT